MISVIIARTRTGKYWQEAKESLDAQIFRDFEVVEVDNFDYSMTIGEAWNKGVDMAKGEFCLFFGDDDILSEDYLLSMNALLQRNKENGIVGVTSFLTAFTEENSGLNRFNRYPTGLFLRSHLLEQRFDETLKNKVDTEYWSRMDKLGYRLSLAHWHFGYFYRQHDNQVSSRKLGI